MTAPIQAQPTTATVDPTILGEVMLAAIARHPERTQRLIRAARIVE